MIDRFRILVEDYGMEHVLEENDLTEEEVLEILYNQGLIDMANYFREEER